MKINLGCGLTKIQGYVGVDRDPNCKPDILADIDYGLNLGDGSVTHVNAQDILEHLEPMGIKEIARLLQSGGLLTFRVPHYLGRNSYNDFTHKHWFNCDTFYCSIFRDYFEVQEQKVHYHFFNNYIRFTLPNLLVKLHERLFPGIFPPSHITGILRRI